MNITEPLIVTVVSRLTFCIAEPSKALRKRLIEQYLERANSGERYLLSLILSFQTAEVFKAYPPKFNTIELFDFNASLSTWLFCGQTKPLFSTLPYTVQQVLWLMHSAKSLMLSASTIAKMKFDYIDPFAWLEITDSTIVNAQICLLCGITNATQLCSKCEQSLRNFIPYRCESFVLKLTPSNFQPVPQSYYGNFNFIYGPYSISRVSLHEINYELMTNLSAPVQLELPFAEYQKEI